MPDELILFGFDGGKRPRSVLGKMDIESTTHVSDFVGRLLREGIGLSVEDGKLRISTPRGKLSSDLVAELKRRKPDLLAFLQEATTERRKSRTGSRIRRTNRVQLVNLYGATETTMTKFFHFVGASDVNSASVPIGRPIDGTAAVAMDTTGGRICAQSEIGELLVRTKYTTLGYYRRPEATAATFVADPLNAEPGRVVFITGDLVRPLAHRGFRFMGRIDQQVKVRGNRVELGEVEAAMRELSGVDDAIAIAQEATPGDVRILGYVTPETLASEREIREELSGRLPAYMVPTRIISLELFPRTASGKVDRKALPEVDAQTGFDTTYVAPETETECRLAEIWSEILGVEKVGLYDDFFALGGHSLLGAQMIARIRASMKVAVPLRRLFEVQTIAELSRLIETLRELETVDISETEDRDVLEI